MNSTASASQISHVDILIAWAAQLFALGIPVVPLCRPWPSGGCTAATHAVPCPDAGKRPLMAGYPAMAHQMPPWDQVTRFLTKFFPCNLGIVVPVGLAIVEADSPMAEVEISTLAGGVTEYAPTRERRAGRGRGCLFLVPAGVNLAPRTHLGASASIDVLPVGSIFVVPPSVHRTGHAYAWVPGRAPWEAAPPVLPPGLLKLAMQGAGPRSVGPSATVDREAFTPQVSSRVAFLLASRRKLELLWNGDGKKRGDTSRSGMDYSLAAELHNAGVPIKEIAEAIAARPDAHRCDADYAMKTALKASRRAK